MTTTNPAVAPITRGFDRFRRSLTSAVKTPRLDPADDQRWTPDLVSGAALDDSPALRMADFGYRDFEVRGSASCEVAIAGPNQVLTPEGVRRLRDVCDRLSERAVDNDYVVSRRIRNVEVASRFVREMMRDTTLLTRLSAIAGTPLVPHPLRAAATQINYYTTGETGRPDQPQVAKWHHDGMVYVFTMQLTDNNDFEGGRYIYYQGHRDDFVGVRDGVVDLGESHPDVHRAPFARAGDTMFTRGSRVWHGVTPVTSGKRTTFAMSMFSPLDPVDENEFWHTAPDDGLFPTIRSYLGLAAAMRAPRRYCRGERVQLDELVRRTAGAAR